VYPHCIRDSSREAVPQKVQHSKTPPSLGRLGVNGDQWSARIQRLLKEYLEDIFVPASFDLESLGSVKIGCYLKTDAAYPGSSPVPGSRTTARELRR
jgi:hypothetical protein